MAKAPEQPGWGIVLVRVAVGAALVHAGGQKIAQGVGPWMIEGTAERIASSPRLFAWWGNEVLLRWPDAFAHLLSWGCLLLGGLMFLGALVRPVGGLIAFLMLNVYFLGPASSREFALLMAVCAVGLRPFARGPSRRLRRADRAPAAVVGDLGVGLSTRPRQEGHPGF